MRETLSQEEHLRFWRQHPAFLFSLTTLIGAAASLFWETPWNYIFPSVWTLYLIFLKKWPVVFVIPSTAIYCILLFANGPETGETEGLFSIASLQPHQSPFTKGFVYKGTFSNGERSFPCDIYTSGTTPPHLAERDYLISGRLDQRGPYQYLLKPNQWTPVEKSWSFAQIRFLAKERYRQFLSEKCPHPRSALFLAALTTGDVEDRLLKYQFGKLGLQHLLAISGFHFGILVAFASRLLSLFLPRLGQLFFLFISLTAYYLFIGPFPAVQRSWLTAIGYLAANLCNRQTSGLNLLGFAMGAEIVLNPLIISNLGFQFSFASTAGILLLFPLFEEKLQTLLPKRSPTEIKTLPLHAKHVYLIASFLRQGIALTLSVNASLLPLLLFHFHSFPLLSLLYNLFFPFCVGIALSSLLAALALQLLIPSLAKFLFWATSWFTAQLLDLAAYPPSALDYPVLVPDIPSSAIPFFLLALLWIAIQKNSRDFRNDHLTNRAGLS